MRWSFSDAFRRQVAGRCAAFSRVAEPDGSAGLKRAAVAITLLPLADQPGLPQASAFLLTRRAKGLRGHGGQWALPGGRCEARETSAEAALRELAEEVGVTLRADAVLGLLDDYPTRSGYLITPVVLWAGQGQAPRADPREVASIHRIGLRELTRKEAADFVSIPESDRRVIRLRINGGYLHAPTAAVLYQFSELLQGRTTRVAELEQPVFAWR
jgi:8-oxo-dGTP pyrophosphatase MutT (NUDIX family)